MLRAVLIYELIRIISGPKILTSCFIHWFVLLFYQGILPRVITLLWFWPTLLLGVTVCLDLKTNLCRFLHALLVPAEAEGHQRPAVWKALPTASAISPVLDHSCSGTHFPGEVDWCSTDCTASWCHRLCSIPNLAFPAHLRASHYRIPFSCFEWNLWW